MDDSGSSDGDTQSPSPTAASILGIKGSLRLRLHGSSQKAHVVLRRVKLEDDSSADGESKPVVYFSLFAQKRIEVKPGKEILVALGSADGRFKDRAVMFEGDLCGTDDDSDDEDIVRKPAKKDSKDVPMGNAIPPKMRRTWTKKLEEESIVTSPLPTTPSSAIPFKSPYNSVGIQVDTRPPVPRNSIGVQADLQANSLCVSSAPRTSDSGDSVTRATLQTEDHVTLASDIQTPGTITMYTKHYQMTQGVKQEPQRERSLSPMELDSPISTPPQSPIIPPAKGPQLNPTQFPSGMLHPTLPSNTLDVRSLHSLSERSADVPLTTPSIAPPSVDGHTSSKHAVTLSSLAPVEPNTAGNLEQLDGSSAHSQTPGFRPLITTGHTSKSMISSGTQSNFTSATKPDPTPTTVSPGTVPIPHGQSQSARRNKTLVSNPFVSGGFVTEFVSGSKSQGPTPKSVKEWFPAEATPGANPSKSSLPESISPPYPTPPIESLKADVPSTIKRSQSPSHFAPPSLSRRPSSSVRPILPKQPNCPTPTNSTPATVEKRVKPRVKDDNRRPRGLASLRPILPKPEPVPEAVTTSITKHPPLRRSMSPDSIASSSASAPRPRSLSPSPPSPPGLIHIQPPQLFPLNGNIHHPALSSTPDPKPAVIPPPRPSSLTSTALVGKKSSPPPDAKSLAYIPSGPLSNPLSIRPSSRPMVPRFVSSATPTEKKLVPKKPVKVGTGWCTRATLLRSHPRTSSSQSSSSSPESSMSISSSSRSRSPAPLHVSPSLSNIATYKSPSPPSFTTASTEPGNDMKDQAASDARLKYEKQLPTAVSVPISTSYTPAIQSAEAARESQRVVPTGSRTLSREPIPKPPKIEINDEQVPLRPSPSTSSGSRLSPSPLATPISRAAPASLKHPLPAKPGYNLESRDSRHNPRGTKRAGSPVTFERPRKRTFKWPTIDHLNTAKIKGDGDLGIRTIAFNSDGSQFAVCCYDRTIRIWNNPSRTELAKLPHTSPVVSVAWMEGDTGVVSLEDDGVVSKWTKTGQNNWQWAKILDAGNERGPEDDTICLAYMRDRIAVAFPRIGVKVWLWVKGTWQPQRSILRQNVTAIKFVGDGEALLGGTKDGVLWYCQVPNGTLRAYAFLKSKIYSIDVSPSGEHALVAQVGGRSHLVGIRQDDGKGKIEQAFSNKEAESQVKSSRNFGAAFASRGQSILFGSAEGCVLVWDKDGNIAWGLDHGEDDVVQAAASFDRGRTSKDCYIVTGTQNGDLTWWPQPDPQLDHPPTKRLKSS